MQKNTPRFTFLGGRRELGEDQGRRDGLAHPKLTLPERSKAGVKEKERAQARAGTT